MRLVVYDEYEVGVLEQDGGIRRVTDLLDASGPFGAPQRMNELISRWPDLRPQVEARRARAADVALAAVMLRCPSPRPRNFLAAPLNYATHRAEMSGPMTSGAGTAAELGFFVKAGGCLSDPSRAIELPMVPDRRFDHEAEVAVIVGREARGVARADALDHVFGYALVLDNTMRMTESKREERTLRKSFWTFSPMGPWLVTADEVPDPGDLTLALWVNDELRQEGSLRDLIVDVPGLVEQASAVLPLEPGDVYATGSPSGVGPIVPGDVVRIASPQLGQMELRVGQRSW